VQVSRMRQARRPREQDDSGAAPDNARQHQPRRFGPSLVAAAVSLVLLFAPRPRVGAQGTGQAAQDTAPAATTPHADTAPGAHAGPVGPAQHVSTGEPWRIVDMPQSTLVYGSDGSLIGEVGREVRTSVPLSSLPNYVPKAFIAIEDHRFYEHNGVDVISVIGALKDRFIGRRMRGASTITQQLVGNMHPDVINRRDMSLERKLREQDAAREMERHYTKAQILEAYLNFIPFGHGWFGVDAAARHYFGTPAGRLTLAQAATLAALPRSAPYYDPIRHPDRARLRRDLVLHEMARRGLISVAEANAARREPLVTVPTTITNPAPYFVDAVREEALRAGVPVDDGGYRLYTTLDAGLERAAVIALTEGTAAVEERPGYNHPTLASYAHGTPNYLEGMLIALDPATGAVRALVGGRDYQESSYDRALDAVRQPGSAFKPFVYAAAVADSIPADAMMEDTALAIPLPDGSVYRPDDADGTFLGPMSMRDALVRSRNSVAVQLGMRVGMDSIIDVARRFGITTPIAPYPSSAIGASAVRPIELVTAYEAFATLGTVTQPRMLLRVDDRTGHEVWAAHSSTITVALDSNVAFIVRNMMRDVVDRGTASIVRHILPPQVPAAGKTGTTNDNTDLWFIGCTPHLVAGVWLGFDTPQTIMPGAAGGLLAAPIWAQFMASATAQDIAATAADSLIPDSAQWAPPSTLVAAELDRQTGALADSTTPPDQRYTEYFLPGTEPTVFDARSVFAGGAVVY
jgi:1A family penicillin-binding protein